MVLPGGTFVASAGHPGNALASAAGVTSSVTPSLPNPLSSLSSGTAAPGAATATLPSSDSSSSFDVSPLSSSPYHLTSLPSYLQNTPWAEALVHPNSALHTLASLPNLQTLLHPDSVSDGGVFYPGYVAQPAPTGITDYGLGATPFSYNTSHIAGSVTFNTPPNATNPGAEFVINPSPGGQHQGAIGSVYTFGIQLNTMGVNVSIPGTYDAGTNSYNGVVWAQNVVNYNDSGIHFISDTWNFSLDSDAYMAQNSVYSGCNLNTAGANALLLANGGVFQCVGGTIPITSADYPITVTLYNNFTTNAQDRSQLAYGYSIYLGGVAQTLSGTSDTVVFNNTAPTWQSPAAPANNPANTIDPFSVTPTFGPDYGFQQDAEIDIVGGIEGSNAVFTSINGSASLQYSNASSGGWKNVPSAYNFGGETGETSTGIAETWTAGHTVNFDQGPTFAEGFWNSQPQAQVPMGSVHIAGSISPSFGFVFVSNTPPVLNPWTGGERDNMSWLPSTTGSFSTYLPPLSASWTTTYYVQAFADGYAETNTTVTAATSSLAITLTAAAGVDRAPLYMNGNAQASALAAAVGASASAPYTFADLTPNVNFTFDHVNDYGFPTFMVFYASGVTNELVVNGVYIGSDSAVSGNSYIYDSVRPITGVWEPNPEVFLDVGAYTSGIEIFDGANAQVLNQELFGDAPVYFNFGSMLDFWRESNAYVNDTLSIEGGAGVWVGDSVDTLVTNTTAVIEATGVQDVGSFSTTVTYVFAGLLAVGIEAYGSYNGVYSWVNATEESIGVEAGYDAAFYGLSPYYTEPGTYGLTANELNATYDAFDAELMASSGTTFNTVGAYDPEDYEAGGIELVGTNVTTINNLVVTDGYGFYFVDANDTTLNGFVLSGYVESGVNSETFFDFDTTFNNAVIDVPDSIAVVGIDSTDMTLSSPTVTDTYSGFTLEDTFGFTATNLVSSGSAFPYELYGGTGTISVTGYTTTDDYIGFNLYYTGGATVTDVVATDDGSSDYDSPFSGAVANYGNLAAGNVITDVSTTDFGVGVRIDTGATDNSVSGVTSTDESTGVFIDDAGAGNTVSDVTVNDAIGVIIDPSDGEAISGVSVTDGGVGVALAGTWDDTVTGTTATNDSLGVYILPFDNDEEFIVSHDITVTDTTISNDSVGVFVVESGVISIDGVTASQAALSSPWDAGPVGVVSAVITLVAYQVSVSNVVATNYPIGLYDEDSGWGDYGPGSIYVQNLNSTGGDYAMVLNDTGYGYFNDIGSYQDYQGVWANYAEGNDILGSSFVDDSSYGVSLWYSEDNWVWDSTFIGDNGATNVYSAAHIQAYSGYEGNAPNYFNAPYAPYPGNYWADWHTYSGNGGQLAPYYVGDGNWDFYPLNVPASETAVWFYESGLPAGTSWSVTFGGVTQSTSNDWLVFGAASGSVAFSAGAVTGYTAAPASGTVDTATGTTAVDVTYSESATVTITETGLPANTKWSAIFGGTTANSTTSAITFSVAAGTYAYQIPQIAGYTASPSSGTVTVSGTYEIAVAFNEVTYAVTVSQSGLGSGQTWSATINGVTQSSTGATITFYLPNGSYTVKVANVSGYSVSSSSVAVTVNGSPSGAAVSYSPTSTTSLVSSSTFNEWLAVAIAIAVIALVLGLLALFMRRGKEPQSSAQQWNPPPSGSTEGAPPASGGSGSWSEGPPAGGSPPS